MLAVPDGALFDMVPVHRNRHSRLRPYRPRLILGLTLGDIARVAGKRLIDAYSGGAAILVGSSVGSQVLPYMYRQKPERTSAMIMSGVGYNPAKEFARRVYRGIFPRGHCITGGSMPSRASVRRSVRRQWPIFLVNLIIERNEKVDVAS